MKKTILALVLLASSAFASELEVPLGARAPLNCRKAIHEVQLRDPSMLKVVVKDGAVSLEGERAGVTGVMIEYADGELEHMMVVVGDGTPSRGMSAERTCTIDLRPGAKAHAKAVKPEAAPKPKATAARKLDDSGLCVAKTP
jgi:hypothetical protein